MGVSFFYFQVSDTINFYDFRFPFLWGAGGSMCEETDSEGDSGDFIDSVLNSCKINVNPVSPFVLELLVIDVLSDVDVITGKSFNIG